MPSSVLPLFPLPFALTYFWSFFFPTCNLWAGVPAEMAGSLQSSFFNPCQTHLASLVTQRVKRLPAMRETWVRSLGLEAPLEKEMATHSSILAWRIPRMEEPGRLQSTGSNGVEKSRTWLSDFMFTFRLTLAKCYLWDDALLLTTIPWLLLSIGKSWIILHCHSSPSKLWPQPFPVWRPSTVSISPRVAASCFPPGHTPFCLFDSVLLVSPVLRKSSITACFQIHSALTASHWVFLTVLLELLFSVLLHSCYPSNSMASNLGSLIASARHYYPP